MYANANKAPGQLEDQPKTAEPKGTSGQLTIKHDFSGLSSSMYAAYKYGLSERGLSNEIHGLPISGEDMSNPDDEGQAARIPIVLQDGDLDPNVEPAVEPQIDRQAKLDRQAELDSQAELDRQAKLDRQAELDRQAAADEAKAILDRQEELDIQEALDRQADEEERIAEEAKAEAARILKAKLD